MQAILLGILIDIFWVLGCVNGEDEKGRKAVVNSSGCNSYFFGVKFVGAGD